MDYDLAVPGSRDLAHDPDFLAQNVPDLAQAPILTNRIEGAKVGFQTVPYLRLKVGVLNVDLFNVVDPALVGRPGVVEGWEEPLREYLRDFETGRDPADLQIVIAHVSFAVAEAMPARFPEIDLLLDGDMLAPPEERVGRVRDVYGADVAVPVPGHVEHRAVDRHLAPTGRQLETTHFEQVVRSRADLVDHNAGLCEHRGIPGRRHLEDLDPLETAPEERRGLARGRGEGGAHGGTRTEAPRACGALRSAGLVPLEEWIVGWHLALVDRAGAPLGPAGAHTGAGRLLGVDRVRQADQQQGRCG